MSGRPEILAPAGSWQTLKAAATAGADAVYFGGKSFNAENFDDGELPEAVAYCHARGIRAHITLNTLLFERELEPAMRFAQLAAQAGADALIVQDLGLASLLRQAAPQLKLHASTQMSVHSLEGVRLLESMGFARVVLARELSKEEIARIAGQTRMELEVFVHGALCMSISGQCTMSAMIGGRSGNRGLCAQPCRLPFRAEGGTGWDLSLKDLTLVERIGELRELGVTSLKIEGRMKRPEYVAAATAVCVKAADGGLVTVQEMEGLKSVFSRSGFTQGYFDAKRGREMFGRREYEDVVAAQNVLKGYRAIYEGVERPRVGVDFQFELKNNQPCRLTANDSYGNRAAVTGTVPEPAVKKAVDEELVRDKLSKTGGTPFFAGSVSTCIDQGLSVPVAEINRLRRAALDELLAQRSKPREIDFNMPGFSTEFSSAVENSRVFLHIRVRGACQLTSGLLELAAAGGCMVFLPLSQIVKERQKVADAIRSGCRVGAELPRAIFGGVADAVIKNIRIAAGLGVKDLLCGNLGAVMLAGQACGGSGRSFALHGDFGLNIANSASLKQLWQWGVGSCVCSFESTLVQVGQAAQRLGAGGISTGIIVYGRLPLMLTRNCPLQNAVNHGCDKCGGRGGRLTDRMGAAFTVVCESGASEVLNDRPVWMLDRMDEVRRAGVRFAELYFTTEAPGEVDGVLQALQSGGAPHGSFTRGLYYRGVE